MNYRANGKLLLSGEYFILDGAWGLALPTRLGQKLHVEKNNNNQLHWISKNEKGSVWFEDVFSFDAFANKSSTNAIAGRLHQILHAAQQLNPDFLSDKNTFGCTATTSLEFPQDWGLGSSSTLIYLVAQWANIDPYSLLFQTFGGSGYDIACAGVQHPILYQIIDQNPSIKTIDFNPSFKENLYFVYLEKKQNSRTGIQYYRDTVSKPFNWAKKISDLTFSLANANTLVIFEQFIQEHEQLVSSVLKLPKAQSLYFSDYWGSIKSLGAWGGDFVLATSDKSVKETKKYFFEKGFRICISYGKMVC